MMNALDPTTLPALMLTADGRILDAATGAIVPADDPAAMPATIVHALNTYARAKVQADALVMRTRELRDALIHDLVDAVLADNPMHQDDLAALQAARLVIDETEAALDGYFADRTDKVSLDTGRVLVTWGCPRTTVTLKHPPSYYAGEAARRDLRGMVQAKLEEMFGMDSREATYPVAGTIADRVIAWLAPTAKTSDAPPVKLTVRGDGAR